MVSLWEKCKGLFNGGYVVRLLTGAEWGVGIIMFTLSCSGVDPGFAAKLLAFVLALEELLYDFVEFGRNPGVGTPEKWIVLGTSATGVDLASNYWVAFLMTLVRGNVNNAARVGLACEAVACSISTISLFVKMVKSRRVP